MRPAAIDREPSSPPGVSRHYAFVRSRLRGLGVPAASLDDATQDVFEVFLQRIEHYDPDRPLRNWLAGIARRVARRHRERGIAGVLSLDESRAAARRPDPEAHAVQREEWAVLKDFLARLDADRWEVFVLSEIEGLRGTEIAAELDVNLNTVYARLRSAHKELDRTLRRHRARERRGLAAWLPVGWFSGTPGKVGLGLAGLALVAGGVLSLRACAHDDVDGPGSPSTRVAASAADGAAASVSAGVEPRAADPAVAALPPADDDGWHNAGSGFHHGKGTVSHEARYRLDGDAVDYELSFVGDEDMKTAIAGYLDLDGLRVVTGPTQWEEELAPHAERTIRLRLQATRDGVVTLKVNTPDPAGENSSSSTHRWRHEGGRLHVCGRECRPVARQQVLSGEMIEVHVVNECPIDAQFVLWAAELDELPPRDAPVQTLAAGETTDLTIDRAQFFHRRDADGYGGGVGLDGPGTVTFMGEDCSVWSAAEGTRAKD